MRDPDFYRTADAMSSAWVVLRHAPFVIVIDQPLPTGWSDLFLDFRRRMRPIAAPTRRELVRHIWRQFIHLPMVQVRAASTRGSRSYTAAWYLRGRTGSVSQETLQSALDGLHPDEMLHLLHLVARQVRRQMHWPMLHTLQKGRGLDG